MRFCRPLEEKKKNRYHKGSKTIFPTKTNTTSLRLFASIIKHSLSIPDFSLHTEGIPQITVLCNVTGD